MRTLFDGEVHVHYGQVYVESGWEMPGGDPMGTAFTGQVNGLCGGASPGFLFMITGLHTGHLGFTVELHDQAPPVVDVWEDIVEVSFKPTSGEVALVQWGGEAAWPLDIEEVDLRAPYSAWGMDQAREADTCLDGQPQLDRYLLQLWPAPPSSDRVLKQTSARAAYWHDWARRLPLPPTPEEKVEAERQAELERQERLRRFEDELHWDGVRPGERLRTVGGNVLGLVQLDRRLLDALASADPDVQRAIARWSARRAYDAAGLSSLDWVVPALALWSVATRCPRPSMTRPGSGTSFSARTELSTPWWSREPKVPDGSAPRQQRYPPVRRRGARSSAGCAGRALRSGGHGGRPAPGPLPRAPARVPGTQVTSPAARVYTRAISWWTGRPPRSRSPGRSAREAVQNQMEPRWVCQWEHRRGQEYKEARN